MNHLQLIVFDWDGTLIDSVARIVLCFQKSFAALELDWPGEEPVARTIGLPLTESYHLLVPRDRGISQAAWVESYRQIWRSEDFLAPSPLFAGVQELLEDLAGRYQLCIATGKSRVGLEREMGHYQLDRFFRETRCANETRPKPDPEMLMQLLQAYGVEAQQALMVGDSVLDIEMGQRAGMTAVAVTSGGQSEAQLRAAGAAHVLARVTELAELLPAP